MDQTMTSTNVGSRMVTGLRGVLLFKGIMNALLSGFSDNELLPVYRELSGNRKKVPPSLRKHLF